MDVRGLQSSGRRAAVLRVFAAGHPTLSNIFHIQAAAFKDAYECAEGNGLAAVHGHNHLPAIFVTPLLVAAGLRD